MQKQRLWDYAKLVMLATAIFSAVPGVAWAVSSNSTNYQVTEMQFGSGGSLESCSDEYCARTSIGDMSSDSASNGSTSAFGPIASTDPILEVIVDTGESNLGELTSDKTATKTMIVRIRTYLSDGYMLQVVGDPPKYKDHQLGTPSTPTASTKGDEQFAINAVANTNPQIGANPVQPLANEEALGVIEPGYNMPDLFKYQSGDVIARSLSSSSRTDYTISMMVNASNTTPAGHFAGDYSVVVTPFY